MANYFARTIYQKEYELKDHLGNVTAVVSDRKGYTIGTGLKYAEILSYNNYYPFGMLQPGRNFNAGNDRYGFNGKEKDDEVDGVGNEYDFGARIYDARLGRFLSIDPLTKKYPGQSPFSFGNNNPIFFIDKEGQEGVPSIIAKVLGGTFSVQTFGSISFGIVKSAAKGMAVDQYGNVALFYSQTSSISVSSNQGVSAGAKATFLPGYETVMDALGEGMSLTVEGGLKNLSLVSVGGSGEFSADSKLVGFGLQTSAGYSVWPAGWSFEVTHTSAAVFSKASYDKFSKFSEGAYSRAYSRAQAWSSQVDERGHNYGFWEIGSFNMTYVPVIGNDGKVVENTYEAVIQTTYHYKPTSGHQDGVQMKEVSTITTENSGVYFRKEGDNYVSTDYETKK